jgi:hypothetical protein
MTFDNYRAIKVTLTVLNWVEGIPWNVKRIKTFIYDFKFLALKKFFVYNL